MKVLKKRQRKINARVKMFNKNIEQDELWKGRFYMRQVARKVYYYEDGSFSLNVTLRIIDKQTGYWDDMRFSEFQIDWGWKHFEWVNAFIIEGVKVWDEHPTGETTIDWRGRKGVPLSSRKLINTF